MVLSAARAFWWVRGMTCEPAPHPWAERNGQRRLVSGRPRMSASRRSVGAKRCVGLWMVSLMGL